MKWTCIDVRTYNENNNGTKTFGKLTVACHFEPRVSNLNSRLKLNYQNRKNNQWKLRDPLNSGPILFPVPR